MKTCVCLDCLFALSELLLSCCTLFYWSVMTLWLWAQPWTCHVSPLHVTIILLGSAYISLKKHRVGDIPMALKWQSGNSRRNKNLQNRKPQSISAEIRYHQLQTHFYCFFFFNACLFEVKFKTSSVIYLQASAGKLVDKAFSCSHKNLTDLAPSDTVAFRRLYCSLF